MLDILVRNRGGRSCWQEMDSTSNSSKRPHVHGAPGSCTLRVVGECVPKIHHVTSDAPLWAHPATFMCVSPGIICFCAVLFRGMLIRAPNLSCESVCCCCPDRAGIVCIPTTVQYSKVSEQPAVSYSHTALWCFALTAVFFSWHTHSDCWIEDGGRDNMETPYERRHSSEALFVHFVPGEY